jgi:hypothetical protein
MQLCDERVAGQGKQARSFATTFENSTQYKHLLSTQPNTTLEAMYDGIT